MRKMGKMAKEYLVLEYWFLHMGSYPLKDEARMGVACVTLRISIRKWRYIGQLQWDIMSKSPTEWANLNGAGAMGMGDTIYARERKRFTKTVCPTRGPRFGKFMRGSKLRMGVIKKHYLGVTSEMIKDLLEGWDTEWRR